VRAGQAVPHLAEPRREQDDRDEDGERSDRL